MKILYFDCSSGISGNMTLGALLEIVGDNNFLITELQKLNNAEYDLEISKKTKCGIVGTFVDVIIKEHDHHHHQHRNLDDVYKIIDNSSLNINVKDLAKRIFLNVAKAESIVHQKPLNEVHFHEVGAIDSIVDIVGTAILIDKIKPDVIYSSVVNDGHGFINCAHGLMSVPVPATTEIFRASKVKFRQIDVDTELVTPTGAAIIAELASNYITLPVMQISKVGYGAGSKDLNIPNLLKVYYGDLEDLNEDFIVMETNIDDSTAEVLAYTSELLFKAGALDVFYTPIYMKKGRPGYRLSLMCNKIDMPKLQNIIFKETSTIGIRYRTEQRTKLIRENVVIKTKYGDVLAKKVISENQVFIYPEYESLKQISTNNNIPLKELYKLPEFNFKEVKNDN